MFKKKGKINPNSTDTLVGEGTVFEGRIKSEASLRIEGHITGDIECLGDVTIGENGLAKSNINARHVTVAGVVTGNISTKGTLSITSSGQVFGNTTSHSLIIAEGGIFQGQSKMVQDSPNQKAERETDQSTASGYSKNYSGSTAI